MVNNNLLIEIWSFNLKIHCGVEIMQKDNMPLPYSHKLCPFFFIQIWDIRILQNNHFNSFDMLLVSTLF